MRRFAELALLTPVFVCVLTVAPCFALDAAASLAQLRDGNARYASNLPARHEDAAALRARLARDGQNPVAAVVACADSRVPVEAVFDQPMGGLFVIRAAGNTVGVEAAGSVQYGVEHLDIPLVVILGHSRCGAVEAVVGGHHADGCLAAALRPIVAAADQAACDIARGGDASRLVVVANVRLGVRTMLSSVPELARRAREGRAVVVGAVYDIESGVVEWLE